MPRVYLLDGVEMTAQASSPLPASPPETLELRMVPEERDAASCANLDCESFPWRIEIEAKSTLLSEQRFLVHITVDGEDLAPRLTRAVGEEPIELYTGPIPRVSELDDSTVCLSIQSVDDEGRLGSLRDLGCIEPPGGCRGVFGSPRNVPVLTIFAVLFGLSRLARRQGRKAPRHLRN